MYHKALTIVLVVGTLSGCVDHSEPRATSDDESTRQKIISPYVCKDETNSGYRFKIVARKKPKTLQTTPDFKMAGEHFEEYELYQVDLKYYRLGQDSDGPYPHTTHNNIKYENISFEYDNQDLIFNIPKGDTLPACEIRFKKRGKTGEHKCKFENNNAPHRATTFKFSCLSAGKTAIIREEGS